VAPRDDDDRPAHGAGDEGDARLAVRHDVVEDPAPRDLDKGLRQLAIELAPALGVDDAERVLDGHRGPVGPGARGRVEGVGDRHDARLARDLAAAQAVRVAVAVDPFVVVAHGVDHQRPERVPRDEPGPDPGMGLHDRTLVAGERVALSEHGVRHGAEPYKRELKTLELHLLDAGHFALESNGDEIAQLMRESLGKHVPRR
jgi:hypothetical protein